jgi:Tfp pilus assembly protein PilO
MINTSSKRIFAVAGLAAVVLLIGWYLALFHPETQHLSAAHKAHVAAEAKINSLQGQVVQLNALKAQIPADKAALAVLEGNVPNGPQLDSALRDLHAEATGSGVSLSSVSPSAPSTSSSSQVTSGTQYISLSMNASGSYGQLMQFLTGLETMPRTVVVTSLNISGTSKLTAQIAANIYYTGA